MDLNARIGDVNDLADIVASEYGVQIVYDKGL